MILERGALACLLLLSFAHPAASHEWYSKRTDPVWNYRCCGGEDCASVNPEWVTEVEGGYRLRMSLEQARTVNKNATAPIDAFIPWDRVQSPPNATHLFDACIFNSDRRAPTNGVICFFVTPAM